MRVAISNEVINARYSLSAGEKSIIYCALARIDQKKELQLGEFYSVRVDDFAEMRGTSRQHARETLLKAEENLFERKLHIRGEDGKNYKLRWITSSMFDREADVLYIKWHESVVPYLSQLKVYCTVSIGQVGDFRSQYTYRLWEILSLNRFKGKIGVLYFDLHKFLDSIEAPSTNRQYKYLKANVLVPAIKELIKKELVYIELKERKQGRCVIGFCLRYCFCTDEEWKVLGEVVNGGKGGWLRDGLWDGRGVVYGEVWGG